MADYVPARVRVRISSPHFVVDRTTATGDPIEPYFYFATWAEAMAAADRWAQQLRVLAARQEQR